MLLPLKWLKDYIKVKQSPKELAELLMFKSFEVEGIKEGGNFDKIVVGKILEIKKHPNADKLKLVKVDIGSESSFAKSSEDRKIQVVCGGTNLKEGMLIAFAKIGAKVKWHGQGEAVELKPAEIRGVKSMGMICAASEIGLKDKFPHGEREILDLTSAKAKVGTPLGDISLLRQGFGGQVGGDEPALELSITPNRSDCLSILGLAREVSALTGQKVNFPKNKFREAKISASEFLDVKVQDKNLCPQYCARVIKGVKIGPSPKRFAERLESMGLRPINNVVDITNFVLFEFGQPLHAFDFKKLSGGRAKAEITVRNAKKGETISALDEKEYNLYESNLVIADGKKPVAIAGVIGGQETAVDEKTRDIVLESAIFEPKSVRLTAKNLGARTDSSVRFERGFDPALTELAINRAADLMVELCGGEVLKGIIRVGKILPAKKNIKVSAGEINSLIGLEIPESKIISILKSLNCAVKKSGKNFNVTPPSYRLDLNLPADIIEEVARIYGYNKLPEKYLVGELYPPQKDNLLENIKLIREEMLKMGFDEVYNSSFYGEQEKEFEKIDHLEIANPMNPEEKYFRASLQPGLFKNFVLNKNNFDEIKIFEIGKVCHNNKEETRIAGAILIQKEKNVDRYRKIKGMAEKLSKMLNVKIPKIDYAADGICFFEFSIPQQIPVKTFFKPLPKFPGITRDLSVIVPPGVKWSQIEEIVKKESGDLFESIELFDIYENSLAFHINFSHPERTLKSEEVDTIISKIIKNLENLGVKIRK